MLWLEGSHVSSYLFERKAFAYMAKEAADRVQKYIETHPEIDSCDISSKEGKSQPLGDSQLKS